MRAVFRCSLLAAALAGAGPTLFAQEKLSVVGPEPSVVVIGETATIRLVVAGPTRLPQRPEIPPVPGLDIRIQGPQERYQNLNGIASSEVSYQIEVTPQREGTFEIPAFRLNTGTRLQDVAALQLRATRRPRPEDEAFLAVEVEPKRVYVSEPFEVNVTFGFQGVVLAEDVARDQYLRPVRYQCAQLTAPWLDQLEGCEVTATPTPQGDSRNIVVNGQVRTAVFTAGGAHGSSPIGVYAKEWSVVPTRAGRITLGAPSLTAIVVSQRRTRQLTRSAAATTIEVLPIPDEGRPTPYFGAVGRFRIDAALDRDTVVVGSSVKLTLTITGQGNFEFLRLPALDELSGFHKLGQAESKPEAGKVVVTYDLTPLSTEVKAVPPIRWNWFDTTPGVEKFVEAETRSLPLAVKPLANGETLAPLPTTEAKAVTPGVDDVFDLPALDGPPAQVAGFAPWVGWLAVLGPWLLAFLALAGVARWRARAADVDGQRARAALRNLLRALDGAGDPTDALAHYLGDRLAVPGAALISADVVQRLVAAGLDEALAQQVAGVVERGTAARYGGGQGPAPDEVRSLAKRLEGVRFGVHGWLPIVLLPLLMLGAVPAPLAAQQVPDATAAVAAYRAGDYRAAEAAFARAFEATGDRRLWRARGNCFFRLGDLPRALWAYESAALGTPRDEELLRNRELVRTRLELPADAGGFVAELTRQRDRLTPVERLLACAACMALAAGLLVFGWRRIGLRWNAVLALLPGMWLAVELLWLAPARPPVGIALQKVAVVSEPRAGLEPVATVRAGVALPVLGGDQGAFVRIEVDGRAGYVPRESIAIVQ